MIQWSHPELRARADHPHYVCPAQHRDRRAYGMAIEQDNDHGRRDRCGDGRGARTRPQGLTNGDEGVRPQPAAAA